ncbi:hypothetical protein K440DRAFT_643506 [Wilcoxina mikolae CBS 423.85]|nr:hypothetical protein K440DRAFT_643506 [Wilcoxina mikolae CBS 423.85]
MSPTPTASAAEFTAKYVTPNVPPGAPVFSSTFFSPLLSTLLFPHHLSTSILTGILCALKRGDLVAPLFSHLVDVSGHDPIETFSAMRSAITTTMLFSGAPQVLPACLGLAGEMRGRGLEPDTSSDRGEVTAETLEVGRETHRDIYKASGNAEVFEMLGRHCGDVEYALVAIGFGLFMGGEGLRERELVLAAAIMAMGARRQAGSHLKACFGFGWTREEVQSVVDVVGRVAGWCGVQVGEVDVGLLEREAREALERQEKSS